MKIISFAFTTPALIALRKTVTRRDWNDRYATRWRAGERFRAYDRSPRWGGQPVAVCEVVSIRQEDFAKMPDSDFALEGFAHLQQVKAKVTASCPLTAFSFDAFKEWRRRMSGTMAWVIRFKVIEVLDGHTARPPGDRYN